MHNTMLFFTQKGLVYKLKVYELPEGARNAKGRALQNLLNIEPGDCVKAFIRCKQLDDPEFTSTHFLVFATRKGLIKKTSLTEYARVMAKGKKAIVIRDNDELIAVDLTDGNSEILMANRNGRATRFHESKVRAMGRVSAGVRGMRLDEDGQDEVVGLITMSADSDDTILTLSAKGYGKRSHLNDEDGNAIYRITNRGTRGVKTMNITEKTGHLVAFEAVNDDNDLVIINQSGITIRVRVTDISTLGRAAQGVRIINLDKRNDVIASVCCVPSDPEEETEAVTEGEALPDMEIEVEAEEPETDDTDIDNENESIDE